VQVRTLEEEGDKRNVKVERMSKKLT